MRERQNGASGLTHLGKESGTPVVDLLVARHGIGVFGERHLCDHVIGQHGYPFLPLLERGLISDLLLLIRRRGGPICALLSVIY